uniref:Uncharacterized protein n=1 Tax=Rhizophora mucronata TaxID=61149 RepID=A0A2P2NI73_RHIMU
MKNGLLDLEEG